ncbi:unnamed protein product [Bursaphelenchus xylophilus]|uniref:(pine wood nematode) hypothetical protein n=1 Tax=Bursaphelenchus xylophilus TaxID=6326 RepID=A0A1I7RYF1_BURXY|nr:unnamed protein product [Bursaphelenchus xylophilus]CAG9085693.1 unnamed protein product [Bursaphelenchus xylophilus]
MDVEKLSNEELNLAFQKRGQGPFPITPSSRKVIERKLLRLLENESVTNGNSTAAPENDTNGTKINGHLLKNVHQASPSRESPLRNVSPPRTSPLRQLSPPIEDQAQEEEDDDGFDGETSARYFSEEERASLTFSHHHPPKAQPVRFYGSGFAILGLLVLLGMMFKIVNDNIDKVYHKEL